MKTVKHQKLVDVIRYVAFDGKVFDNENACAAYEQEKQPMPLYKKLAVSQELASYSPNSDELYSRYSEDTDITIELSSYTIAVVEAVLTQLEVHNSAVKQIVYQKLGLSF